MSPSKVVLPIFVLLLLLNQFSVLEAHGNDPPNQPSTPSGPTVVWATEEYTFSSLAIDPNNDRIRVGFDWGDGLFTWTNYAASGTTMSASHSWCSCGEGYYSVRAKAQDEYGLESPWSSSLLVYVKDNKPPLTPSKPTGPTAGTVGISYAYTTSTTDANGADDQLKYLFDWGDGTTAYSSLSAPGVPVTVSHSWTTAGLFAVKAKAYDSHGGQSQWSLPMNVNISAGSPPSRPSVSGPSSGSSGVPLVFTASSVDPDGHQIHYRFEWGDGVTSGWSPFISSGLSVEMSHSWGHDGTYVIRSQAADAYGLSSEWSDSLMVVISTNHPPSRPSVSGPSSGSSGVSLVFTASSVDPDGNQIHYRFEWGDGVTSGWSPFISSGVPVEMSYSWEHEGTYLIRVQASDTQGLASEWSTPFTLLITYNNPPSKPSLTGTRNGTTGTSYIYTATSLDQNGDQLRYYFYWGDGEESVTDFVSSGESAAVSHVWAHDGVYNLSVIAVDINGAASEPATLRITMPTVRAKSSSDSIPVQNLRCNYITVSNKS